MQKGLRDLLVWRGLQGLRVPLDLKGLRAPLDRPGLRDPVVPLVQRYQATTGKPGTAGRPRWERQLML